MAKTSDVVVPTRMELLRIKNRIKLAEKGHRLLKEKRDALVMEFMKHVKDAQDVSEKASKQLEVMQESVLIARAMAGSPEVSSAAYASQRGVSADVGFKNVMGVNVPQIQLPDLERGLSERGWGLLLSSPSIDKAAEESEKALSEVIKLAEAETALSALALETQRTKRRVNALEYRVLPKLMKNRKYIRMRLEELERENFVRLKAVKNKKNKDI